jgi:hypothetical protein
VEDIGLEEDLDVTGLEDTSDGGGHDCEEEVHKEGEEGHEEGAGLYDEGVGDDGSGLGSASSHRLRSSHLVCPLVAPRDDNKVIIIPCDNG